MQTFEEYHGKSRVAYLDGLRAISVIMVIWHHLFMDLQEYFHGALGVNLFFFISGLIITTLLLREQTEMGRVSFRAFFIRRTLRIMPLYYVFLVLHIAHFYTPSLHLYEFHLDLKQVIYALLFFYQEVPFLLDSPVMPFPHSWSLGIEEKFYLVWPFLGFYLFVNYPRWRLWLTLALAVGLKWNPSSHAELFGNYAYIFYGCFTALLLEWRSAFEVLQSVFKRGFWQPLCLVGILYIHTHSAADYHAVMNWFGPVWVLTWLAMTFGPKSHCAGSSGDLWSSLASLATGFICAIFWFKFLLRSIYFRPF